MLRVNSRRVDELAEMVKAIGFEKVIAFEDLDPQFRAVKKLVAECGLASYLLVFLNALISYRLSQTGEIYWSLFADYVATKCVSRSGMRSLVEIVEDFAKEYNRYLLNQKIKRIEKIIRCTQLENILILNDLETIRKTAARCLKVDENSKTIVFAIKMIYYVNKAFEKQVQVPLTIPIPVDTRVAIITYLSGALDLPKGIAISSYNLLKFSKTIRSIWTMVGEKSSVPPLNLDALLWYFGKYHKASNMREIFDSAYRELQHFLKPEDVMLIVKNLFYRMIK